MSVFDRVDMVEAYISQIMFEGGMAERRRLIKLCSETLTQAPYDLYESVVKEEIIAFLKRKEIERG